MTTITANEKHDVKRAIRVLPDEWDTLRRAWQRVYSSPQYFLIPQVGAEGHFHVHLLHNSPMGTRWWKDHARHSGFGYQDDESEEEISPWRGGWYVTRYVTRQLAFGDYARGFHRIRTSRHWPKVPPMGKSEGWEFRVLRWEEPVAEAIAYLTESGYHVYLADYKTAWTVVNAV